MQAVLAVVPPASAAGSAMQVGRPSSEGWTATPARPAASSRSITRPGRSFPARSSSAQAAMHDLLVAAVRSARGTGWYTAPARRTRIQEAPMMRATTWITGLALSLVLGALPAVAQTPPTPFATTKITDTVYLFRYGGQQAIFVVTPAGVIATDPIGYLRPPAVTTYIAELRK